MTDFTFTSPEGKNYTVSGPDGSTKEQAFAMLQQQLKTAPAQPVQQQAQPTQPQPATVGDVFAKGYSPLGSLVHYVGGKMMSGQSEAPNVAGEKVTDIATQAGLPAPVAAGLGVGANVGLQGLEMYGGGKAVGETVAPGIRDLSERLMKSSLKPALAETLKGQSAIAINTMLDEGIGVTKGGIRKLKDKVTEIDNQIRDKIANSTEKVNFADIYKPLHEKLIAFRKQVNPDADIASLQKSWSEFKNHPLLGGQTEMPVQLAQELKQGTYKQVGGKNYGELKSADIEAQKAIAAGLKEGISAKVPEVAGLNAQESKLLTTLNIAEKRVILEANKNPMGFSVLAQNPKMMALYMADKSAPFKALLARVLNRNKVLAPAVITDIGIAAINNPADERARRKKERANP